jgi:glycosyltransferase involved in cell wall biosynthesis
MESAYLKPLEMDHDILKWYPNQVNPMASVPDISVVMAAYNEAPVIRSAIDSILNQTLTDFEFIIVDDGSTDETLDIVRSYDDDRISVVENNRNLGLTKSLNRGIERSNGRYIARMDADDRSLPTRLQRQYDVLERNATTQVAACSFWIVSREFERLVRADGLHERPFDTEDLLENGPGFAHGSTMIRRSAVKTIGGYCEAFRMRQDFDLWLRLSIEFGSKFVKILPEPLYEHRLSADKLHNRPQQRLYSSYARKAARQRMQGEAPSFDELRERAAELRSKSIETTSRQREAHYQYLVGMYLQDQGNQRAARHRFLSSIRHAPFTPQPWYRLGLSVLPDSLVESIESAIRAGHASIYT